MKYLFFLGVMVVPLGGFSCEGNAHCNEEESTVTSSENTYASIINLWQCSTCGTVNSGFDDYCSACGAYRYGEIDEDDDGEE